MVRAEADFSYPEDRVGFSPEEFQVTIHGVFDALRSYEVLAPLRPERYWRGEPTVESFLDVTNPQGIPLEVDYDKKRKTMAFSIGRRSLEEYMSGYADDNPAGQSDILKLFTGFVLVHDLAIRALSPDKADDFIEHITKPNGLYGELLASGLLDLDDNDEVIREYLIGDEDRIAKVNVARFAIGATCEALHPTDKQFRGRITDMFRPEFTQALRNGVNYRRMAQEVFEQDADKAREMFVEHIKDFDLAAAFPKTSQDVHQFVEIYSEM